MYRRTSRAIPVLMLFVLAAGTAAAQSTSVIMTAAGGGAALGDGGLATDAQLTSPRAVAVDTAGNVYISDFTGHRVRKVTIATGVITTVAGTGTAGYNGDSIAATSAQLSNPAGLAVDASGNLFIADRGNHRVRFVSASSGLISTVAGTGTGGYDGDGAAATAKQINYPLGVAVDGSGNFYIADYGNHRVRKVTYSTGYISTTAGTGTSGFSGDGGAATSAQLANPRRVAIGPGNLIFIADTGNNRIRVVSGGGIINTLAGNGSAGFSGDGGAAVSAALNDPVGLAFDADGNLYIADSSNNRIRQVAAATGTITTVAGAGEAGFGGDGGAATAAALDTPQGVAAFGTGTYYIADGGNARVRRVTAGGLVTGTVTNSATSAALAGVTVFLDSSGGGTVAASTTNSAGAYTLTAASAGTYYLHTHNTLGYVDEVYDNLPCYGGTCTAGSAYGTAVTVTAGAATTGKSFGLAQAGTVSGTVTDANSSAALSGVSVFVYNAGNTQLTGATTNASGQYTIGGLPAGSYYVKTFNSLGYIDEVYNNIPCPLGVCPNPSTGTAVAVAAGATAAVNVGLTAGGTITGSVTNASSGTPLSSGFVYFYSGAGSFLGSAAIASGTYTRTGLLAGTYFLKTNNSLGYIDEVYDDLPCTAGTCPPVTSGTGVAVGTGGTTGGINFGLVLGGSITGTVAAAGGAPIQGVTVHIYNSAGTYVTNATTDSSGAYSKLALQPGPYYVRTYNTSGYIDQLFNGIPCVNGACTVTSGSPAIVPIGGPVNGIDFTLAVGGTISGTVTAAGTGLGVAGVSVRAYSPSNTLLGTATTSASGFYTIAGLATATHYVATNNSSGYVDELYNDIPCPGSVCPLYNTGTPVAVTAGSATGPIDFALAAGGTITGAVTAAGGVTGLSGAYVYFYNSSGVYASRATTNASGVYTKAGLPADTYYLVTYNEQSYVDELYDNVPCPGTFYCTVTSGTGVPVSAGATSSGINFALDPGGTVTGTLTSGGSPASYMTVRVYDASGKVVGNDQADVSGAYSTSGMPAGTYYVRTHFGNVRGYVDEVYNNLPCVNDVCPALTSGAGVAVAVGSAAAVNFDLSLRGTISGTVIDALTAAPVANVTLHLHDAGGTEVASTTPGASGAYAVVAVPAGTYYVRTSNPLGYLDELYNNLPCPGGSCTVTSGAGVAVASGATAGGIDFALIAASGGDFTGDHKADILWRHTTGGDLWLWPMDGAAKQSETYVRTVADTNWEIRAVADFTGDGRADILWRNTSDGLIYLWPMNGTTPASETYVATVDTAYDIIGAGDFNGDGMADILWRNPAAGDVWIWLMNGAVPLSRVYVDTVDPAYLVKGVGDLDANAKADIVWSGVAGDVWVWLMNGAARLSQNYAGTVPDTNYQIQRVADFDGNGKADILWWNSVQGDVWLWPMNGAVVVSESYVGVVQDTNYRIVGAGDYNGDTRADILWRNVVQGDVWVWLMNGGAKLSENYVGAVPDLGYQIVVR